MFHAFDNVGPGKALHRADWIALLSRAPVDLLESVLGMFVLHLVVYQILKMLVQYPIRL